MVVAGWLIPGAVERNRWTVTLRDVAGRLVRMALSVNGGNGGNGGNGARSGGNGERVKNVSTNLGREMDGTGRGRR